MFRRRMPKIAAVGLVALIVAGCGGGGSPAATAATDGDTGGESTAATSVSTTVGAVTMAEVSSTAGAVTTEPAGAGGATVGVCELVTADELAVIFNVPAVTTSVLAGPPDNCIVESDAGDPLTAWSLTVTQAEVVFDAFASDPASIEVPGIGDKAAIV